MSGAITHNRASKKGRFVLGGMQGALRAAHHINRRELRACIKKFRELYSVRREQRGVPKVDCKVTRGGRACKAPAREEHETRRAARLPPLEAEVRLVHRGVELLHLGEIVGVEGERRREVAGD